MFNPTSMCLRNPYEVIRSPKAMLAKQATDFGVVSSSTISYGIKYFTPEWLDVGETEAWKLYDRIWDELEPIDSDSLDELEVATYEFEDSLYFLWSEPWAE